MMAAASLGCVTHSTEQLIADAILEIGDGYRAKNSEMGLRGLPFARAGNINGGFHFEDADILDEASVTKAGDKVSHPGDIVFTSKGTVGRFAFVRATTQPFVYSPQLCFWRVKDTNTIDPRFLFCWMRGHEFRDQVNQVKGLTDMADYVNLNDQRHMKITLPPLPTQRKIAAILAAYDDLIENNTRRIAILEAMAQAIYREWFVNFRFPGHEGCRMVDSPLGPIPEAWEVVKLGEVAAYINRGISPKYEETAQSIVLNQKCIRNGKLSLAHARRHASNVSETKRVQFGDVLINSTGIGTLGRVAQMYLHIPDCTVDSHVTIVRPSSGVGLDYFGMALLQLEPYFDSKGTGTTGQTELSRDSVSAAKILLPPGEIQSQFGTTVEPVRHLLVKLAERISNLSRTRDLLLPKLVSGEVDVAELEIEYRKGNA